MKRTMGAWGKWLRILCAIALLSLGLAHKPPAISAEILAGQLSDYVLPDGTLPILCVSDHGSGDATHPSGLAMRTDCEACRLGSAIILPLPPVTAGEPMAQTLAILPLPLAENLFGRVFPPNASPRAPPLAGLMF